MDTQSSYNWKLIYIGIPLLPFLLGGFIKSITIISSSSFAFTILNLIKVFYFSWDTVAFSFSISIMAFFVKNDINERILVLPNSDRCEEVARTTSTFFMLGMINVIFFGILLLVDTRFKNCHIYDLKILHVFCSIIIYVLGYFTIKGAIGTQRRFNLTSKWIL